MAAHSNSVVQKIWITFQFMTQFCSLWNTFIAELKQNMENLFCPYLIDFEKIFNVTIKKILPTGNTRPSRMCVIQEYWINTMSLNQYHWCCQYHESMSIPWVHVYSMSPCLYDESMFIPWVRNTNDRNTNYRNTKIPITEIQKYKLQK